MSLSAPFTVLKYISKLLFYFCRCPSRLLWPLLGWKFLLRLLHQRPWCQKTYLYLTSWSGMLCILQGVTIEMYMWKMHYTAIMPHGDIWLQALQLHGELLWGLEWETVFSNSNEHFHIFTLKVAVWFRTQDS